MFAFSNFLTAIEKDVLGANIFNMRTLEKCVSTYVIAELHKFTKFTVLTIHRSFQLKINTILILRHQQK